MEIKKDAIVLSIRTKYGENLLGYYVGDNVNKLSGAATVILYRPIIVKYIEYHNQGKIFQNYEHAFYFPFGGPMVEILVSDIRHSDVATDFFSMYYAKILGEEIVNEERLQNRIIAFYEEMNVRDVMAEAKSDSMYMKVVSEHLQ